MVVMKIMSILTSLVAYSTVIVTKTVHVHIIFKHKTIYRSLYSNQIGRIMKPTFSRLPAHMSSLLLYNNDLAYIEDGSFDHFTSFTSL